MSGDSLQRSLRFSREGLPGVPSEHLMKVHPRSLSFPPHTSLLPSTGENLQGPPGFPGVFLWQRDGLDEGIVLTHRSLACFGLRLRELYGRPREPSIGEGFSVFRREAAWSVFPGIFRGPCEVSHGISRVFSGSPRRFRKETPREMTQGIRIFRVRAVPGPCTRSTYTPRGRNTRCTPRTTIRRTRRP